MARKPRIEFSGAFYHVLSRGNRQSPIFNVDDDRERFLKKLLEYKRKYGFILYAYALMHNHFHLLMETRDIALSRIMQGLLQSYTQWYNRRYSKVGHLFRARYSSILCDRDTYVLNLIRYLHLHCVRAGLVKDPAAYQWSSHRVYLGLEESELVDTDFVLSQFVKDRRKARKEYREFIQEWIDRGSMDEFYKVADQRILGDEDFVMEVKRKIREKIERADCCLRNKTFHEIAIIVKELTGVSLDDLQSQKRMEKIADARGYFVRLALLYTKCRRRKIAEYLRKSPRAIPFLERRISDKKLDQILLKVKR
jgi:putative transposase